MENINPIPAEEGGDLYLLNENLCKWKDIGLYTGKNLPKPPAGRDRF